MELLPAGLASPVILFFVLGLVAAFARSDLAVPEAIAKGLSLYLMAAIGLKGGVAVAKSGFTPDLALAAAAGAALSFLLPVLAFALLTWLARLDRLNAGAVSAHYGSVSVVTFVTALEILEGRGLSPAGYMVAVLALMETPAIVTGLLLARREGGGGGELWREVLLNGSVVLLIGSFLVGLAVGPPGYAEVSPFFEGLFKGVLCIFLLDMGLIAARRLVEARRLTPMLGGLAVALPLVNGAIGTALGTLIGLDVATAAALGILAASASYIAVPAAMRLALPQADPGLYLAMSLGITFPFNVIIGIPLFAGLAAMLG